MFLWVQFSNKNSEYFGFHECRTILVLEQNTYNRLEIQNSKKLLDWPKCYKWPKIRFLQTTQHFQPWNIFRRIQFLLKALTKTKISPHGKDIFPVQNQNVRTIHMLNMMFPRLPRIQPLPCVRGATHRSKEKFGLSWRNNVSPQ